MKKLFFVLVMIFSFFSCGEKVYENVGKFVVHEKLFYGINKAQKLKLVSMGGDTLEIFLQKNSFFDLKTGDTVLLKRNILIGDYDL